MFRVELIAKITKTKTSVLDDIIDQWVASGRDDNRNDGQFVFEDVASAYQQDGILIINKDANIYFYNIADFYRVKIISYDERDLFDE